MRYPSTPEIIATVDEIDNNGNELNHGDKILGIQVRQEKSDRDAVVDLDIRSMTKQKSNLVIRVSLPELVAALSCATLNAEREKD